LVLVEGVVVPLDSLVGEEGVVAVPEDFGVGVVSGIFGGFAVPVNSGFTAGVPEAFGVGVTAPGGGGVGVPGVVAAGVTGAGVEATATVTGRGLWGPSLLSAA
jgi:hypothetical protein